MSNGTFAKVSAKTAAEICKHFQLGEEAQKLLRDNQAPRQFLDVLLEKKQYVDACRFLAHALPKREAERWVAATTDATRRAAMPAAEAADIGTPAGCTAVAAFFSGGSLAPPNVQA